MLEDSKAGRVSMELEPEALRVTEYEIVPGLRGQRYGVQLLGQAVQFARSHVREKLVLRCGRDLAGYFAQYGFTEEAARGGGAELSLDLRRVVRDIPALEEREN